MPSGQRVDPRAELGASGRLGDLGRRGARSGRRRCCRRWWWGTGARPGRPSRPGARTSSWRQVVEGRVAEPGRARLQAPEAQEDVDDAALARSARPDDGHPAALGHRQVEAVQRPRTVRSCSGARRRRGPTSVPVGQRSRIDGVVHRHRQVGRPPPGAPPPRGGRPVRDTASAAGATTSNAPRATSGSTATMKAGSRWSAMAEVGTASRARRPPPGGTAPRRRTRRRRTTTGVGPDARVRRRRPAPAPGTPRRGPWPPGPAPRPAARPRRRRARHAARPRPSPRCRRRTQARPEAAARPPSRHTASTRPPTGRTRVTTATVTVAVTRGHEQGRHAAEVDVLEQVHVGRGPGQQVAVAPAGHPGR